MSRLTSILGSAAMAAATLFWSAAPATAQHHGGGGHGGGGHGGGGHAVSHGGGGHGGGGHVSGYHGGWNRGYVNRGWNRGWHGGNWNRGWGGWGWGLGLGYYGGWGWPYSYGYGYPYYGWYSSYPSYDYYSYPSYDYYNYGYPYAASDSGLAPLGSYATTTPYPGSEESMMPAQAINEVTVNVEVPSNAQVWFEGQKTNETGSSRTFVSPPVNPNQEYIYHIRARWQQNGKTMDQTKNVTVHAGDRITVDFRQPNKNSATTSSAALPPSNTASTPASEPVP